MEDQKPKTNEDFTVEDLLNQGWTRTLIDNFLGREDYRNTVDHFRNYSGKKMFVRRRVEAIEASSEFEDAFMVSAKRRKLGDAAVGEVRARMMRLRTNRDGMEEPDVPELKNEEIATDPSRPPWAGGYRTPHK
jgi:hypothetical protein